MLYYALLYLGTKFVFHELVSMLYIVYGSLQTLKD